MHSSKPPSQAEC